MECAACDIQIDEGQELFCVDCGLEFCFDCFNTSKDLCDDCVEARVNG